MIRISLVLAGFMLLSGNSQWTSAEKLCRALCKSADLSSHCVRKCIERRTEPLSVATVKSITRKWLIDNGYGGLCNLRTGCDCTPDTGAISGLANFMHCRAPQDDCRPGVRILGPFMNCTYCRDLTRKKCNCEWRIEPGEPNPQEV